MMTLALIGAGKWGKNYLKTTELILDCRIKYICTSTKETLSKFPNSYIKTTNYQELINYEDIDGIIIATTSSTHFETAKFFIQKGYDLLIEKPFTTSYSTSLKLQALAKKSKSLVMVGHIYLYHPAFIKLIELLRRIGKVIYFSTEGSNFGPIRTDTSVLWDWTPHDLSMVSLLIEEDPINIAAWGVNRLKPNPKLFDMVYLRLQYSNGIQVFSKMGWLSPVRKRSITIVGEGGSLIFDDCSEHKIQYINAPIRVIEEQKTYSISYPQYTNKTALQNELEEFVTCIKLHKQPKSDINLAIKIAKLIHFAEQSLNKNGAMIKIK